MILTLILLVMMILRWMIRITLYILLLPLRIVWRLIKPTSRKKEREYKPENDPYFWMSLFDDN